MSPEQFLALCQPAGLDRVFERLPTFVVVLDGEGSVLFWNRAIETVTGLPRADVLGRDGSRFVSRDGEGELRTTAGEARMVKWQCYELEVSTGIVTYAFGADVTEERANLQRTLQAERSAAAATLSAGIAHEIRNPLNSAVLQLDVLENRIEQGQVDQESLVSVVATARDELRRAGDAAGALLGLAPARRLVTRPIDLNELLEGVAESKGAELRAANATLELQLDGGIGEVEIDGERIHRAIASLVDNAIEAAPRNARIVLRSSQAQEAEVVIEVEDDGPGFEEATPVFDAFFTTKPGKPGLGLAVARRIALDHGGKLEAHSRKGRTCFRLALPRRASSIGQRRI